MEGIFTEAEYKRIIRGIIVAYWQEHNVEADLDTIVKIIRKFENAKIEMLMMELAIDGNILPMWSEDDNDLLFVQEKVVIKPADLNAMIENVHNNLN